MNSEYVLFIKEIFYTLFFALLSEYVYSSKRCLQTIFFSPFYQRMFIHQRNVLQTLLMSYLLLSYDGVQGEIKLSKLEELALDKQLKLLNKPAVKTIKTEWGDTYDCVDFYKQPAFDHPSLNNHNFHPEMKSTLSTTQQIPSDSTVDISSRIWSENESCPFGTVPIKRVTKDDLIRQRRVPPLENLTFEAQLEDTNNLESAGRYMVHEHHLNTSS
ncbi:uncharacterized protein LOC132609926 [Lycium barbarum]|uniref:uncharacterized protein LOC132609926 n=1 Tax=Lycium barbarum TaxID=112863 RepID=UPI00293E2AAE|nr:uncharacterized protein LOC132609926 [Lycium barbarum]